MIKILKTPEETKEIKRDLINWRRLKRLNRIKRRGDTTETKTEQGD